MADGIAIHDQPAESRFELSAEVRLAGFVTYRMAPGRITFIHTEVDPAFAGRGFGSKLARYVLDDARARSLRVVPRCPFIAGYIRSHPAYDDLVAKPQGA
jgi:uncharacterized protein